MDINYLNLEFNGCKTKIELLDTPVARKWIEVFNQYKSYFETNNFNYDYKVEPFGAFKHDSGVFYEDIKGDLEIPSHNVTLAECVDKINQAIEDVNVCIDGKEFPYYAYLGMPWEQTNLIHRCFTTASITNTNWKHNLTAAELIEYNKIKYLDNYVINDYIKIKEFTVIDYNRFIDAIRRINEWTHVYEGVVRSRRSRKLSQNHLKLSSLVLDWDRLTPSGEYTFGFSNRVSYEELKQSFIGNYEEQNVVIGVSVLGKDYETAFCDYDNPLEYDITNLDYINGSITIINNKSTKDMYRESKFIDWINDYNIEREMYLPVPLGKVVENSCDFNSLTFDFDSDERWTNGSSKPSPPFNKVKSWISVGKLI
jgi:hypothetical protein